MREINNPTLGLLVGAAYKSSFIALVQDGVVCVFREYEDLRASKDLLGEIEGLMADWIASSQAPRKDGDCKEQNHEGPIDGNDLRLAYIAAIEGPGAFTSLRVSLTLINAIALAKAIPLVGIDGLEVIDGVLATKSETGAARVVLQNAYNNELYYRIQIKTRVLSGYAASDELKATLASLPPHTLCGGDGTLFLQKFFETHTNTLKVVTVTLRESADTMGKISHELFTAGKTVDELEPRYLKEQVFKKRDE